MRRLFLAIAAVLLLASCGSQMSRPARRGSSETTSVPASAIRVAPCLVDAPPCTALTPEGARGADQSHYFNGPARLTLTGSSIRIDAYGLSLIEGFENTYEARYCPFWDPYGHVWTRAFGETDWSGNFGGVCISHAQAEANVRYLVEVDYQYAVRGLGLNLSQRQVDALDDFVWNLGAGIFTGELRVQIQRHEWSAILGYDIAGGVVLPGLQARRETEYRLLVASPPVPPQPSHAQLVARWHAELDAHYRLRKLLEGDLARETCLTHPQARYGRVCVLWRHHLAVERQQISAFHAKGIY
jgi:GH24 family phage-related lysozyme (muramidase)